MSRGWRGVSGTGADGVTDIRNQAKEEEETKSGMSFWELCSAARQPFLRLAEFADLARLCSARRMTAAFRSRRDESRTTLGPRSPHKGPEITQHILPRSALFWPPGTPPSTEPRSDRAPRREVKFSPLLSRPVPVTVLSVPVSTSLRTARRRAHRTGQDDAEICRPG